VSQWGRCALVQSALVAQPSTGSQHPLVHALPALHWVELVQLKMPFGHWPAPRHCPAWQVWFAAQSALVLHVLGDDPLEQALSAAAAKSEASRARERNDGMGSSKT